MSEPSSGTGRAPLSLLPAVGCLSAAIVIIGLVGLDRHRGFVEALPAGVADPLGLPFHRERVDVTPDGLTLEIARCETGVSVQPTRGPSHPSLRHGTSISPSSRTLRGTRTERSFLTREHARDAECQIGRRYAVTSP